MFPSRYMSRLGLVITLSASSFVNAGQTCYARALGNVYYEAEHWYACGGTSLSSSGAETCCLIGSECGEDSLCRASSGQVLGNNSNNAWFVAGCTDITYEDPVCRTSCSKFNAEVIENSTDGGTPQLNTGRLSFNGTLKHKCGSVAVMGAATVLRRRTHSLLLRRQNGPR